MSTNRRVTTSVSVAVALAVGASAIVIGMLAAFAKFHGVDPGYLAQEPQVVLKGKAYAGAVSSLGVVVWTVPVVTGALASALGSVERRAMFVASTAVTAVLLFDHLFLARSVLEFEVGINRDLVAAVYLALVVGLMVVFRRQMGAAAVASLGLAISCWSVTEIIEHWFRYKRFNVEHLTSAGIAFVGIMIWTAVWSSLAFAELQRHSTRPDEA